MTWSDIMVNARPMPVDPIETIEPERDVKLYLGCGWRRIPGFVHIDPDPLSHVDHIAPLDRLDMFEDDSVDLIYASHVLQKFGRYQVFDVLCEWYRALRPGGRLRLAGPDFSKAAEYYLQNGDIREVIGLVVGGQTFPGDLNLMLFDEENLGELLIDVGFTSVDRYDWRATEHAEVDDLSQAYLPHLDKQRGMLVSLNVEAVK